MICEVPDAAICAAEPKFFLVEAAAGVADHAMGGVPHRSSTDAALRSFLSGEDRDRVAVGSDRSFGSGFLGEADLGGVAASRSRMSRTASSWSDLITLGTEPVARQPVQSAGAYHDQ